MSHSEGHEGAARGEPEEAAQARTVTGHVGAKGGKGAGDCTVIEPSASRLKTLKRESGAAGGGEGQGGGSGAAGGRRGAAPSGGVHEAGRGVGPVITSGIAADRRFQGEKRH
jgi:hypothetical protein